MANKPDLRAQGRINHESLDDYISAMKTIRSVRSVFFLLLVVSLLIPLACFGGATWGKIQPSESVGFSDNASGQPPAAARAPGVSEGRLYEIARHSMRFAPFVARFTILLLILIYLISTNVCLSGRLGGAHDSIVALFWAVFLMLLLIPWHSWIGAGDRVNLFYDLDALLDAQRNLSENWLARLGHYVRFVLFPFLGLLTAVVADIRFGRCYRQVMRRIRRKLEVAV